MKITALMTVINEEDYVYYALRSVYNVVDEIVIVEGAARNRFSTAEAVKNGILTINGLSHDRTSAEIGRLIDEDEDRKVHYFQLGWVNEVNDLRNACLKMAGKDTDYCLVLDADVAFLDSEIRKLREILERHPEIWMIAAKELMFFLDLNHILTVDQDKLKYCNYLDSGLFWKYTPELEMIAQRPYLKGEKLESLLKATRLVNLESSKFEGGCRLEDEDLLQEFHYGWVHRPREMEQHILRWAHAKINAVIRGSQDEKLRRWCEPIIGKSDEEILEYYRAYHKIWTGIYDETVGEHLEEFHGEHPEVMKKHPFYGKSKEELGWDLF